MGIVVALMLALLGLLAIGWFARKKRQANISAPTRTPADLGRVAGVFSGKYVATTIAADPLDRIAVHGLGFRGAATVTVAELGLSVSIVGRDEFWIPRDDVCGVRLATWTIDRVVEKDGLHLITWRLGGRDVDSYFRMDAPGPFSVAMEPFTRKLEP